MPNTNRKIVPADRIGNVTEYYFSSKLREIAELRAAGRDIISLGVGGPDRPPHEAVIDTLCGQSRRSDTHSYQSYIGIPELREAFAEWYGRRYGVTLDPRRRFVR